MPIDLELLQKIERQRQRIEDGARPALIEGLASPAKKEASFAATTPPSSQELSSSFVTPSSRSSSPELGTHFGSYRLTEGGCEALSIPWPLDLEEEAKTPDVEDDFWMHGLWPCHSPSEASLAATAQICLGAPERCPSRDLSPVDETKVMAWRPRNRRRLRTKSGVPTPTTAPTSKTRPAWSSASKADAKTAKTKKVSPASHSRGAAHPSEKNSTELQLRRLSKELAAEGQRFRQQGKLCFELAVRAEALHSEVRVQQQQAAREREAKLVRAAGQLQGKVISLPKDNS